MQKEELLNILSNNKDIKISYGKIQKDNATHIKRKDETIMNIVYDPPKRIEDIFDKKKPERIAVIKHDSIYFSSYKNTNSKAVKLNSITHKRFSEILVQEKISIIEVKINNVNSEIDDCKTALENLKIEKKKLIKKLSDLMKNRTTLLEEKSSLKDKTHEARLS